METMNEKRMPTPEQRPDLYDAYDYPDRPEGYQTGVAIPERIQKLIDARKAAKPAPTE